jgi:hypothetical protein
MESVVVMMSVALLVLLALVVYLVVRPRRGGAQGRVEVDGGGIESLRNVGELVVLRALYSVPATGHESIWGEKGRKFLKWLWSDSRTIMIFRFEIAFKYDLRRDESAVFRQRSPGVLEIRLGTPRHDVSIKDVRFYHTEQGRLLDWLLPRALSLFQSNMDDDTRQRMLEAARQEAVVQAEEMISVLHEEARRSAEATLMSLAHGLGYERVIAVPKPDRNAA